MPQEISREELERYVGKEIEILRILYDPSSFDGERGWTRVYKGTLKKNGNEYQLDCQCEVSRGNFVPPRIQITPDGCHRFFLLEGAFEIK